MADTKPAMAEEDSKRGCCRRLKDAVSLVPRDASPPNWGILWLVFISLFSSAFTLTFLFPFLPEMILTFGYGEEEKGTYVGLVASSVFAGRAVGSFFWGWLSDLKGRRLVLLITICLNGLFSFAFGFAHSLHFAMVLRFLAGLSNGTVGVAKTVLYDVSDNSNQAFSMSVISIAWGSGLILGPTLGGYLALPATKYPATFSGDGFFADFPFVLPSVCCLVVCSFVFVVVFFKFQEPTLVLNTEVQVEAIDPSYAGRSGGDSGTAGSSHTAPASQPLLHRLHSTSSTPSPSARAAMSLETLHCESELSYYYARLHSQSSHSGFSSEDKAVSKSMHNLSPPRPVSSTREEESDLPPVARRRSYSHGHRAPYAAAVDGLSAKPKVGEVLSRRTCEDTRLVSLLSENISGRLEGTPCTQGKPEAEGEVKGEQTGVAAGKGDVAVVVNGEGSQRGDGCEGGQSPTRSWWWSVRHSALIQLLRQRDVQLSVALYTVMSFAVIGFDDVFTIFASTSKDYDGLGFSTDEIGLALGVVSIPLMFIQIKLYPILVSKFGIKRAFLINIFFVFIPIQLMPMVHLLADNKPWLWVCIVSLMLPLRVAINSCFAGSSILINNSVTADNAGKANGIGMTFTAVARTLAPTVGGAMFSWSLKMNKVVGAPLDVNLTFVFFGAVVFISALQSVFLPDHLDHQKK